MRVKAENLSSHLTKEIGPAYLISGDEPLLSQEAADEIRQYLHNRGYLERELFDGNKIPWDQFSAESNSMSLFGDKRLLEVRTTLGGIGDKGSEALAEFCQRAGANPPETVLLLITDKLDKRALGRAWVKRIEEVGVHVQVWPVQPNYLQGWLTQRLRRVGIEADSHAVEILAERVEGNLLAAKQEIDKLLLLSDGQAIDARTMSSLISNSSRYDVFTLVDRALEGKADDACRTLRGLREEGIQPLHILAMLTRELRVLIAIQTQVESGTPLQAAITQARIWKNRMPLVRKVLQRSRLSYLQIMLRQARGIDQAVKGVRKADPWLELTDLVLNLSGDPALKSKTLVTMLS